MSRAYLSMACSVFVHPSPPKEHHEHHHHHRAPRRPPRSSPELAALALAAAPASARPATAAAAKPNIVETAVAAGNFTTLVSLVKQAGLADTLSAKGPYTVFAPTDAAFKKVPKKTLKALGKDKAKLKAVLLYHVASGRLAAKRVVKRSSIKTLNGKRVKIRVRGRNVFVNRSKVVTADVRASNGIIHAINRVLIPRDESEQGAAPLRRARPRMAVRLARSGSATVRSVRAMSSGVGTRLGALCRGSRRVVWIDGTSPGLRAGPLRQDTAKSTQMLGPASRRRRALARSPDRRPATPRPPTARSVVSSAASIQIAKAAAFASGSSCRHGDGVRRARYWRRWIRSGSVLPKTFTTAFSSV